MYKNKIKIIVAHFGKRPIMLDPWYISALHNESIDFLIFTDIEEIQSKNNIEVIHMSFKEFKSLIQNNFDFQICCDTPYKICDFRPAYGEICKEYLNGYDFWGYCDTDLVFGDIRKFFSDELLDKHDRCMIHGHISLYRNNELINSIYKAAGCYPEYNYQEVYTTNDACYFDEYRGMELKCLRNNIKLFFDRQIYINANPKKTIFENKEGDHIIGIWEKGRLYIDNHKEQKEILYIHICKRDMKVTGDFDELSDGMFIAPGVITPAINNNKEDIFKLTSGGKLYIIKWYFNRLKKLRKSYSLKKLFQLRKRMKDIAEYKEELLLNKAGEINE